MLLLFQNAVVALLLVHEVRGSWKSLVSTKNDDSFRRCRLQCNIPFPRNTRENPLPARQDSAALRSLAAPATAIPAKSRSCQPAPRDLQMSFIPHVPWAQTPDPPFRAHLCTLAIQVLPGQNRKTATPQACGQHRRQLNHCRGRSQNSVVPFGDLFEVLKRVWLKNLEPSPTLIHSC